MQEIMLRGLLSCNSMLGTVLPAMELSYMVRQKYDRLRLPKALAIALMPGTESALRLKQRARALRSEQAEDPETLIMRTRRHMQIA